MAITGLGQTTALGSSINLKQSLHTIHHHFANRVPREGLARGPYPSRSYFGGQRTGMVYTHAAASAASWSVVSVLLSVAWCWLAGSVALPGVLPPPVPQNLV